MRLPAITDALVAQHGAVPLNPLFRFGSTCLTDWAVSNSVHQRRLMIATLRGKPESDFRDTEPLAEHARISGPFRRLVVNSIRPITV